MINSYTKVEPWKRKMAFAAVKIKSLVAKAARLPELTGLMTRPPGNHTLGPVGCLDSGIVKHPTKVKDQKL